MTYIPDVSDIQAAYVVANSTSNYFYKDADLQRTRENLREEFKAWYAKELLKAKRELITEVIISIREIPCWKDPITGLGGFDLDDDGSETGAYNEVTRRLREIRSGLV